jgi:hypothetical protein
MNPQTYLTGLTFLGLTVGLIGGLISQLTKTSAEVDGTTKKRLTSSGRWALAISLLGFAGSFSSEMFKSSIKAQEAVQAKITAGLREERERQDDQWKSRSSALATDILGKTTCALQTSEKNLIATIKGFETEQQGIADSREKVLSDNLVHETRLYGRLSAAGTPLTTMTLKLIVENVPREVRRKVVEGLSGAQSSRAEPWYAELSERRNVNDDDDRALVQSRMDQRVIQPFIDWLGGDRFREDINWRDKDQSRQQQGVLVLSLDRRFSALACVGWVSEPDIFTMDEGEPGNTEVGTSLLPSGVLIGDEIQFRLSPPGQSYELKETSRPAYQREKTIRPVIKLDVVSHSLVLTIELDQYSLDDSLLRYARNSSTTAALPDDVEFFSWSPSSDGEEGENGTPSMLPFDSLKVHEGVQGWKKEVAIQVPTWMRHMRLQIIPNGVEQIAKTYDLKLSSHGDIMEGLLEDEPLGYVRLWHGHAR